jgi:hypothetical protein
MACLHDLWQRTRRVVAVLAIVRFSLLIAAILAVTLIMADQMIDILRAVGEAKQRAAVGWLLAAAAFCGLIVWYAARTMLRFRFASNPASDPELHPRLKRVLPRLLGIAIPAMLAFRVALLAHSSSRPRGLWMFTATLTLVTAVVAFYVFQRRRIARVTGLHILASPELQEARNLSRFRQLPNTTRRLFITLIAVAVAVNALFHLRNVLRPRHPCHAGRARHTLARLRSHHRRRQRPGLYGQPLCRARHLAAAHLDRRLQHPQ